MKRLFLLFILLPIAAVAAPLDVTFFSNLDHVGDWPEGVTSRVLYVKDWKANYR